eukprot:s1268_g10.t1
MEALEAERQTLRAHCSVGDKPHRPVAVSPVLQEALLLPDSESKPLESSVVQEGSSPAPAVPEPLPAERLPLPKSQAKKESTKTFSHDSCGQLPRSANAAVIAEAARLQKAGLADVAWIFERLHSDALLAPLAHVAQDAAMWKTLGEAGAPCFPRSGIAVRIADVVTVVTVLLRALHSLRQIAAEAEDGFHQSQVLWQPPQKHQPQLQLESTNVENEERQPSLI